MAAKEMEKKMENQKGTGKKRRRLKRSVRKTFGAIFLASAIAVAAIPTEGLQAANTGASDEAARKWGTLKENMKEAENIPEVTKTDTIYTTGDGKFQFVYKESGENATQKVAILVGYDKTSIGELGENDIEIVVFQHLTPPWRNGAAKPPPAARPRNSRRVSCSR